MDEDMPSTQNRIADALRALRDKAARPDVQGLTEAATRSVFIEPLLAAMGFEGLDDIEWEYLVKASNERIDYVLKLSGQPTIAVEAKSFGTDLLDKHAAQLVQYGAVEGIEWCLLSNGRQMRVYNAALKGGLAEKHLIDLDFLADEPTDAAKVLVLVSKEGLARPDRLTEWMRSSLVDRTLRVTLLDPSSDIIMQLADAASAATGFDTTASNISHWFATILGKAATPEVPTSVPPQEKRAIRQRASFWLLPAGTAPDGAPPVDSLRRWLGASMWGMGRSTPNRKRMREGDLICFYAAGIGVVAWALLAGPTDELLTAEEYPEPAPMDHEVFRIPLKDIHWLSEATVIDDRVRSELDAFQGKKPSPAWGWFVQTTTKLSERDFRLLTKRS